MRTDFTFMQERVCDCGYRKWDKQSVHVSSFLQVSCSSIESAIQQELTNCIAISIHLSLRFDWLKFCTCTCARRSDLHCRASFTPSGLITSGSGTLSNVHHSSILLFIYMTVAGGTW